LFEENLDKWRGEHSRMAALYFLARPERIAVCDFFIGVIDVWPWLSADHPMHGRPLIDVYRYLIGKYLRPSRSILDKCEVFFQAHLAGGPFVACTFAGPTRRSKTLASTGTISPVSRRWKQLNPTGGFFC